jgi:hypothetical protein
MRAHSGNILAKVSFSLRPSAPPPRHLCVAVLEEGLDDLELEGRQRVRDLPGTCHAAKAVVSRGMRTWVDTGTITSWLVMPSRMVWVSCCLCRAF